MTDELTATERPRRPLGRRHVLALAGGGAVAAALAPAGALAALRTPDTRLSIGYLPGSESLAALPRTAFSVIPASTIAPEPSLAGGGNSGSSGAKITVLGLFPGAATATASRYTAVWFDALFKTWSGNFPYSAWSFAGGTRPRVGSRVRFLSPVDGTGCCDFAITVTGPAGKQKLTGGLSLDPAAAGARLRPGIYLFGLAGGTWAAPATVNPGAPSASQLSVVVRVERA